MFRRCVIKLFLNFFVFLLFVQSLASPQSYKVTEQQLLELEMFSNNLNQNNLLLQSQVQKLKTESKTLSEQLTKERELSKAFSKSCAELDLKLSKEHQIQAELNEQVHTLELKIEKKNKHIIILYVIIGVLGVAVGLGIFLKIKKIF